MIFFNNPEHESGCAEILGKSRENDDRETARINLTKVPDQVSKIDIFAVIYEGDENGLTFSKISDSCLRIWDFDENVKIFDTNFRSFSEDHTVKIASLIRFGSKWKMQSTMRSFECGISELADIYGFRQLNNILKIVILFKYSSECETNVENMKIYIGIEGFNCEIVKATESELNQVARDADCILLSPSFNNEE